MFCLDAEKGSGRDAVQAAVVVCCALGGGSTDRRVGRKRDVRRQIADRQWPTEDSFLGIDSLS